MHQFIFYTSLLTNKLINIFIFETVPMDQLIYDFSSFRKSYLFTIMKFSFIPQSMDKNKNLIY